VDRQHHHGTSPVFLCFHAALPQHQHAHRTAGGLSSLAHNCPPLPTPHTALRICSHCPRARATARCTVLPPSHHHPCPPAALLRALPTFHVTAHLHCAGYRVTVSFLDIRLYLAPRAAHLAVITPWKSICTTPTHAAFSRRFVLFGLVCAGGCVSPHRGIDDAMRRRTTYPAHYTHTAYRPLWFTRHAPTAPTVTHLPHTHTVLPCCPADYARTLANTPCHTPFYAHTRIPAPALSATRRRVSRAPTRRAGTTFTARTPSRSARGYGFLARYLPRTCVACHCGFTYAYYCGSCRRFLYRTKRFRWFFVFGWVLRSRA